MAMDTITTMDIMDMDMEDTDHMDMEDTHHMVMAMEVTGHMDTMDMEVF